MNYTIIDFETTGLSPKNGDRVIEVGAVRYEDGEILETYQSLIDPNVHISPFITDLTGITNKMVKRSSKPRKVFGELLEFVADSTLVAHNANFDRRFWNNELSLLRLESKHPFLCTLLMARRLYPWLENHKLGTLVEHHDIPQSGHFHRALADASMTADLFLRIHNDLSDLYPNEVVNPKFLQNYQTLSRAKAKAKQPGSMKSVPTVLDEEFRPGRVGIRVSVEKRISHEENGVEIEQEELSEPKVSSSRWIWWVLIALTVAWFLV